MAGKIHVTVHGNVVNDPLIRRTPEREFVTFRLASTGRIRQEGVWTDGKTEWFDVCVFGQDFGANVAKSLRRGNPVVVSGRLSTAQWTDKEGRDRTDLRITADSIGHDLVWGQADFTRVINTTRDANQSPSAANLVSTDQAATDSSTTPSASPGDPTTTVTPEDFEIGPDAEITGSDLAPTIEDSLGPVEEAVEPVPF